MKRSPKLENIMVLREKILSLRRELESLEKIEVVEFSPVHSNKGPAKENSFPRSITPSPSRKLVNPESPVRSFIRNKSKEAFKGAYTSLKVLQKVEDKKITKNTTLRLDLTNVIPQRVLENRYEVNQLYRTCGPGVTHPRQYQTSPQMKDTSTTNFLRFHEDDIETPRFQRTQSIKTYKLPQNNPILNPPVQIIPSRKIFQQKNQSPSNIYLNHSGSNPNMYISPKNQQMIMSTKRHNRTNVSELIADTLMTESECSKSPTTKVQKRHYQRHFAETISKVLYRP